MKLAFLYGKFSSGPNGPFDATKVYEEKGFTGSESFFFNTVKGMAERGHEVHAYFHCTEELSNVSKLAGAHVHSLDTFYASGIAHLKYDAVLSWNEPDLLRWADPASVRICEQQLNDFTYCQTGYNDFVDMYACPSESHRQYVTSISPGIPAEKSCVVSNCLNLEFYDKPEPRDPFKIVYCSSPDRGLHWLLEMFPQIRKAVPQAKLSVYYKVQPWIDSAKTFWHGDMLALGNRARYVNEALQRLGTKGEHGVTLMGPVSNVAMAKELLQAKVLAYPCDTIRYTEGFSVSILDACAAGCVPVITDCDAIGSVYKDVAHIIPGKPADQRQTWLKTLISILRGDSNWDAVTTRAKAFAQNQSRQIRAAQWEKVILELKAKKEGKVITVNPIPIQEQKESTTIWNEYKKPDGYPKNVSDSDFPVAVKTPFARAWGIPEKYEFDDLPLRMTEDQLQSVVLLVWKEYMLHDEVMAALRFLEDAPVKVKHTIATQQALALTKRTLAWMDSVSDMQKFNQPEHPEVECGTRLPEPLRNQQLMRFELICSAANKVDKIVDFGCFDGALTNRMGLAGFDVTGVDVCESSIDLANRKAKEFNTNANHIASLFQEIDKKVDTKFDLVTCADTYEHVRDPVTDIIVQARKILKPSGRMVVVTPYESWMRGQFIAWAHPWRWGPDANKPWMCDEPRAHLVAPTAWTVAANFRKDGWWVKNSFPVLGNYQDVPYQGNIFAVAYVNKPSHMSKEPTKDIVIYLGNSVQTWTPFTAPSTRTTEEDEMVQFATNLVDSGHSVRVYNNCSIHGEGIYNGVEYHNFNKICLVESCDTVFSIDLEATKDIRCESRNSIVRKSRE